MDLFLMWASIFVTSFSISTVNKINMIKDVADNGYKLNMKEESNYLDLVITLVPVVNLLFAIYEMLEYYNNRELMVDDLRVSDCLVSLTKEEEERYKQNPTIINALGLYFHPKIKSDISISYKDNNNAKCTIYFKVKKKRVTIVKTEGPILSLPTKEQRAFIERDLSNYVKEMQSMISLNELDEEINTFQAGLNKTTKTEPILKNDELSDLEFAKLLREEKKKQLEELRKVILNSKPENNDVPQLRKKR